MNVFFKILLFLGFAPAVLLHAGDESKPPPADNQIGALISGLGAEKFETREESQAKLTEAGKDRYELVLQECKKVYFENKDPEVRLRLKNILRSVVTERNFQKKAFIGISMSNSPSPLKLENNSYLPIDIVNVMSDLPAEKSGIRNGDRILKIDDKICDGRFGSNEAVEYISAKKPGSKVVFLLRSGDETVTREVVTTERPALPNEPTVEQLKEDFFNKWFKENMKSPDKQQKAQQAGQERK